MMSNSDNYKALKPGERLNYVVAKYFRTQQEFAEAVGLDRQVVNQYITGRTAKVPLTKAMQIEAKTGISSQFIITGEGADLVDGAALTPLRPLGNVVPPSLSGESSGIVNIADLAFDSLKNPVAVHVVDVEFCRKYDVKVGVTYIIDKEHYTDGNIVLAKHKLEFFIAQLYEGKLMDIARSGVDIAFDDTVKIIGAVYKKLEMI